MRCCQYVKRYTVYCKIHCIDIAVYQWDGTSFDNIATYDSPAWHDAAWFEDLDGDGSLYIALAIANSDGVKLYKKQESDDGTKVRKKAKIKLKKKKSTPFRYNYIKILFLK